MKTIGINFIFSITLILVLFGCNKENDCYKAIGLNGEWIWLESTGGIKGEIYKSESYSNIKKLIIDDFIYKEFIDDSLILETEYELGITDKKLLGTKEKTFIKFESGIEKAVIISNNELELIDQCYDWFRHRYKRN